MVKSIQPDEVSSLKETIIPDGVIDAFNKMIAKHYNGNRSQFTQEEVVDLIVISMGVDRASVYENKWLDVEPIYREHGWKVEYDKPGYNESYKATFTFSKKGTFGRRY